jgi:diadenosine tetraphosphate (Ap4A) HIT family hydrolase
MYMKKSEFRKIYSARYFDIMVPETPHISREDGGHLVIVPKREVADRTQLTYKEAIELIKLSMIFGEALKKTLKMNGIDVERVNYQENGNWVPKMHLHLYGRAKSAVTQKYGEALNFPKPETGVYDKNNPLSDNDINKIKVEAEKLLASEKYSNF